MRNKERCRLKFVSNPVPTIHIKFNHAISGVNAVGSGSAGGYSYEISKNENPIDQDLLARFMCVPQPTS